MSYDLFEAEGSSSRGVFASACCAWGSRPRAACCWLLEGEQEFVKHRHSRLASQSGTALDYPPRSAWIHLGGNQGQGLDWAGAFLFCFRPDPPTSHLNVHCTTLRRGLVSVRVDYVYAVDDGTVRGARQDCGCGSDAAPDLDQAHSADAQARG